MFSDFFFVFFVCFLFGLFGFFFPHLFFFFQRLFLCCLFVVFVCLFVFGVGGGGGGELVVFFLSFQPRLTYHSTFISPLFVLFLRFIFSVRFLFCFGFSFVFFVFLLLFFSFFSRCDSWVFFIGSFGGGGEGRGAPGRLPMRTYVESIHNHTYLQ